MLERKNEHQTNLTWLDTMLNNGNISRIFLMTTHVLDKFHGKVAYVGSILGLCAIAHICGLGLEYVRARRSRIINLVKNKGNWE